MQIINVRDNENNRWKRKAKDKDRKKQRSGISYGESVRSKWFCCMFKLGFVQLICEASLIFKLNLSIILKERELFESKHVMMECRCLKICNLLSFLICFDMF